MRIALSIAFVLGLVLKVLHLPYHTVMLLLILGVGLVWQLVHYAREDKAVAWAGLAVWGWAAHLVAVLKLFPFRTTTLLIAAGLTVIALLFLLKRTPGWSRPAQVLTGVFILVMLVMAQPVADRFHFTNLAFSVERTTDVHSWDKYSFLLQREGRTAEALDANSLALEIASTEGGTHLINALTERRTLITQSNWDHYVALPVEH
ncbi:MAG TPA: hypothetical protein PLL25_08080 [Flavobacteriales bacterium]|nr:hypothetical protein [Flavobacteriales bacterium]